MKRRTHIRCDKIGITENELLEAEKNIDENLTKTFFRVKKRDLEHFEQHFTRNLLSQV